jgi:hypothetical protein
MRVDDTWLGALRVVTPLTTSLLLLNIATIFTLATINAFSLDVDHLTPTDEPTYASNHILSVRIQTIFYWCTIPFVYLVTSVTENICLWRNRLRPLYVIIAAIIALIVWALQLAFWIPCLFASVGPNDGKPPFCPAPIRQPLDDVQTVGRPTMVVYAVPSLGLLQVDYHPLTLKAY